jgi:SAM-dependent methyltransferase
VDKSKIVENQKLIWNSYASGWDTWEGVLMPIMLPVGQAIIRNFKIEKEDTFLDVASGTGMPGMLVAENNPDVSVTGCDLSEQMVTIANRRAKDKGLDNYQSIGADATNLPMESSSFDHCMCRFGLMFFPDMNKGLSEMLRVLTPGGDAVVVVWGAADENAFITLLADAARQVLQIPDPPEDAPGVFRCARAGFTMSLMQQAGFKHVSEIPVSGLGIFESPEHYWKVMKDVAGPIMDLVKQASSKNQSLVKELVIKNASQWIDEGMVKLPWCARMSYGIKPA